MPIKKGRASKKEKRKREEGPPPVSLKFDYFIPKLWLFQYKKKKKIGERAVPEGLRKPSREFPW